MRSIDGFMRRDGCMPLRPGTKCEGAPIRTPRTSAWTFLRVLPLILILHAGSARAIDLTLSDGTVLKDVQLRGKTDLGIRVKHSEGMIFIDYSRIDPSELQTWGFEEAKYRVASAAASSPTRAQSLPFPAPQTKSIPKAQPDAGAQGIPGRQDGAHRHGGQEHEIPRGLQAVHCDHEKGHAMLARRPIRPGLLLSALVTPTQVPTEEPPRNLRRRALTSCNHDLSGSRLSPDTAKV